MESPLEMERAPYAKAQRHFTRTRIVRERMVGMRLWRSDTLKRLESKAEAKALRVKNEIQDSKWTCGWYSRSTKCGVVIMDTCWDKLT